MKIITHSSAEPSTQPLCMHVSVSSPMALSGTASGMSGSSAVPPARDDSARSVSYTHLAVCALLVLVAIGCLALVTAGVYQGAMEQLREEGDYTRPQKKHHKLMGTVTMISVSYTHLDVYKRQGLRRPLCFFLPAGIIPLSKRRECAP